MPSTDMIPKLKSIISTSEIQARIGKLVNADSFTEQLIGLINSKPELQKCTPQSIVKACLVAASLRLPVNQVHGYAYIVPYGTDAQFQLGYKGMVQLALDTKLYKTIHATPIYADEFLSFSPLTGDIEVKGSIGADSARFKGEEKPMGYYGVIETKDGFREPLFMTRDSIEKHAKQYSKAYAYDLRAGKKSSPWSSAFDEMAQKTVLRRLLGTYGKLSPELKDAFDAEASDFRMTDVDTGETVKAPPKSKEVKSPKKEGLPEVFAS